VTIGGVFLKKLHFSLPVLFSQFSIVNFIRMLLLTEGQTEEAWESLKKNVVSHIVEYLVEKYFF
jgi:hypothetical protein